MNPLLMQRREEGCGGCQRTNIHSDRLIMKASCPSPSPEHEYVCVCTCMFVCAHEHVHVSVHMYVHMCVRVSLCPCMCAWMALNSTWNFSVLERCKSLVLGGSHTQNLHSVLSSL